MEILIFDTRQEDRIKNPISIDPGTGSDIDLVKCAVLAGFIRSNSIIDEFTSEDMYQVFENMESKEEISDEAFLIANISNLVQTANQSSRPQKVDLEAVVFEIEKFQRPTKIDFKALKGKYLDLNGPSEESYFEHIISFFKVLLHSYLVFQKEFIGDEDDEDDSSSEEEEEEEEEDGSEDDGPKTGPGSNKKKNGGKKKKGGKEKPGLWDLNLKCKKILKEAASVKDLYQFLHYTSKTDTQLNKAIKQIREALKKVFQLKNDSTLFQVNNLLKFYLGFPVNTFNDFLTNSGKNPKKLAALLTLVEREGSAAAEDNPEPTGEEKYWEIYEGLIQWLKTYLKVKYSAMNYTLSGMESLKKEEGKSTTYITPYLKWFTGSLNFTTNVSIVALHDESKIGINLVDVIISHDSNTYKYADIRLSKLEFNSGYRVFKIMEKFENDIPEVANHQHSQTRDTFWIPCVNLDNSIKMLMLYDDIHYKIQDFDCVEYYSMAGNNIVYESFLLGKRGALFVELIDKHGIVLKTFSYLLERGLTLNEQFSKIYESFHQANIDLQSSYIKKNMRFDDDTIGWNNTFGDYLDVVKGFNENLCSPVFQLVVKEAVIAGIKRSGVVVSNNSNIGKISISDLLLNDLSSSLSDLEKLGKKI